MRYLIKCLFLAFLVIGCTSKTPVAKLSRTTNNSLCGFLRQEQGKTLLNTYQNSPSVEESVRRIYPLPREINRWDQSGPETTNVVEWWQKEAIGDMSYVVRLKETTITRLSAIVSEPVTIEWEAIENCLGTPTYFAIRHYPFAYTGYGDVFVEQVFLYYVEDAIEISLIKPRGSSLTNPDTNINFTRLMIFVGGELQSVKDYGTEAVEPRDIQVWNVEAIQ